jgi:CYTH domain-containing protein
MATEIERKFLVAGDGWRSAVVGAEPLRQGYVSAAPGPSVRVRTDGSRAWLTIKCDTPGLSRLEFEYDLPLDDADALLNNVCGKPLIEKVRHRVVFDGRDWVVDVFAGALDGLVLAEIELAGEDDAVSLPSWLGREVTHDLRFRNAALTSMAAGDLPNLLSGAG